MKTRYAPILRAVALGLCMAVGLLPALAHASSVHGTMDVRLRLQPSCDFVTRDLEGALLDFGRSDLAGRQPLDSMAEPRSNRAFIEVACSSAYTGANAPMLTVDYGLHAIGSQRYLLGPEGERIAYDLFADPARHIPLDPVAPMQLVIPLAGAITAIPIYGRIPQPGDHVAGRYTDVVWLTLSY